MRDNNNNNLNKAIMIIKNKVHNYEGNGERDEMWTKEWRKVFSHQWTGMQVTFQAFFINLNSTLKFNYQMYLN